MTGDSGLTRRSVLRAGATTVGLAAVGATAASGDDEFPKPVPPLSISESEDQFTTVDADGVPETSSGIGPGSFLLLTSPDWNGTRGCTANFVWTDGDDRYLGTAGHCLLPAGVDATENAGGNYDPESVQTRACVDCTFGGATGLSTGSVSGEVVELGDVVYARQAKGDEQVGHDFGLVEIPARFDSFVDPSMPVYGGPETDGDVDAGETVCLYGNGVVAGETVATKGRTGSGISHDENSWQAAVPASPGDSGAAVQGARPGLDGISGVEAAGTLTHLTTLGIAGTTTSRCETLADKAGLDVEVVLV